MRVIRYIIFVLVIIGLIWLIVLLFQSIFSRPEGPSTVQTDIPELSTYADGGATSSMTIQGPINANSDHYAVRITVDRTQSKIEVMTGYNSQVTAQQAYANSSEGYRQFLSALDRLDFTKGNDDPELQNSAGACPFGKRYIYTLGTSSEQVVNLWTTSCSPAGGTLEGNRSQIRNLFLAQIPREDLRDITRGLSL